MGRFPWARGNRLGLVCDCVANRECVPYVTSVLCHAPELRDRMTPESVFEHQHLGEQESNHVHKYDSGETGRTEGRFG
jgi:hypothetical protein